MEGPSRRLSIISVVSALFPKSSLPMDFLSVAHSLVQHKPRGKLGRQTRKHQKASIGREYKYGGVCGFRIGSAELKQVGSLWNGI